MNKVKTAKKTTSGGKKAVGKTRVDPEVLVCVNCGSVDVESPSLSRGSVPGTFDVAGIYTCKKCDFTGLPVSTTLSKAKSLSAYIKKKRKVKR